MQDRVIDISNWRIHEGGKNRDNFRITQLNPDPTQAGLGFGSKSPTQHWVRVTSLVGVGSKLSERCVGVNYFSLHSCTVLPCEPEYVKGLFIGPSKT
jgi:hypothetical protein